MKNMMKLTLVAERTSRLKMNKAKHEKKQDKIIIQLLKPMLKEKKRFSKNSMNLTRVTGQE